jgi:hypothetical protein
MTKGRIPDKATTLVYAERVNMLEGLTKEEADTFLQENPTLVPLNEIDVVKKAEPYQISDEAAIVELSRAREALEWELAVMRSEFIVPSLWVLLKHKLNKLDSEHARVEQLLRLEEERIRSMEAMEHEQRLRKAFVDRHRKRNEERFGKGKVVLLF